MLTEEQKRALDVIHALMDYARYSEGDEEGAEVLRDAARVLKLRYGLVEEPPAGDYPDDDF
jgi:hypothetical protein